MPWADAHYLSWAPAARFFRDGQDFADQTGKSTRMWVRLEASGRIHWYIADEIATALGTHPELIWGAEWHDQADRLTAHEETQYRKRRATQRQYKRKARSRAKSVPPADGCNA